MLNRLVIVLSLLGLVRTSNLRLEADREDCVKLAEKLYVKLLFSKYNEFIEISKGLGSNINHLEQCIGSVRGLPSFFQKEFHNILYEQNGKEVCKVLSSEDALKVTFLLTGAFSELVVSNHNPENEKAYLRTFYVEYANRIYKKLGEKQGKRISMRRLFGSDRFRAELLMSGIEKFGSWSHQNDFSNLLIKGGLDGSWGKLSFDDAINFKLLLFEVFSELAIKDYDHKRGIMPFRAFNVKLAKEIYKKIEKGQQDGVSIEMLFGVDYLFRARLLILAIRKLGSWYQQKRLFSVLFEKGSNELCKMISVDDLKELKVMLVELFPEIKIKNYNYDHGQPQVWALFKELAKKIYNRLKVGQGSISMKELFGSDLFEARLLSWGVKEFGSWLDGERFRNFLYKEESNELYEQLSAATIINLKLVIFWTFPMVEVGDNHTLGNKKTQLEPFFTKIAKKIYERIGKRQDTILVKELFDPDAFLPRLLRLGIEKFGELRHKIAFDEVFYKEGLNKLDDHLLPRENLKLVNVLVAVFPKILVENDVFENSIHDNLDQQLVNGLLDLSLLDNEKDYEWERFGNIHGNADN